MFDVRLLFDGGDGCPIDCHFLTYSLTVYDVAHENRLFQLNLDVCDYVFVLTFVVSRR